MYLRFVTTPPSREAPAERFAALMRNILRAHARGGDSTAGPEGGDTTAGPGGGDTSAGPGGEPPRLVFFVASNDLAIEVRTTTHAHTHTQTQTHTHTHTHTL